MAILKHTLFGSLVLSAAMVLSQTTVVPPKPTPDPQKDIQQAQLKADQSRRQAISDAEKNGTEVRVKDVARFRGVRSNQLQGIGLVVGLNGTGDTKNTPFTANLLANAMKEKTLIDPKQLKSKNVAVVFVSAELPPFASPGNRIDITVTSAGDANSLQGGYLLRTPLYGPVDSETAYVVSMGPVSIGGFNVTSGGASLQKNHTTVGKLPSGGIVEQSVATTMIFDGKMYLELEDADFTTAQRLATKLNETDKTYLAVAEDGGTIKLSLPEGKTPVQIMSEVEGLKFFSDTAATVVINENTGTIVMGGNVRIGPALVAKGSLTVRIEQELLISQPNPFSFGATVVAEQTKVSAEEQPAQVTMMGPTTTIADLARIFQALKISAQDMIAILEALRAQGALKARIKTQ
ncbi:MAG: flagellar basal body P-ring protein FlgI [Fimbriimonadaceae bacterium]